MAGVCFFFEESDVDVWSGKNLDAWNYAFKMAGDINRIHVINRTNQVIQNPDSSVDFTTSKKLSDWEYSGKVAMLLPPWRNPDQSLWNFNHNVDWYVFGPALDFVSVPDASVVTIPMCGQGALHAVHAATVVMAHRYHVLGGE